MGWLSYVVTSKVVNVALAQHGVVLELRLSERRCVACRTIRLCSEYNFAHRGPDIPAMITSLAFPERRVLRVDL